MQQLTTTKQLRTKYNWEAAWQLYIAGATLDEVATILSIPYPAVVHKSASQHWAARRGQATVVAKQAVRADLKRMVEDRREKHQRFMLKKLESVEEVIEDVVISTDPKAAMPIERFQAILDKHDITSRRVLGMDKADSDNDPIKAGFLLLTSLGQSLVNEKDYQEAEIVTSENEPKQELPHHTPSTDVIDPLTGILRSGNGISDPADNPIHHPFAPENPQIGATGLQENPKPMPERITIPLVNETPTHE